MMEDNESVQSYLSLEKDLKLEILKKARLAPDAIIFIVLVDTLVNNPQKDGGISEGDIKEFLGIKDLPVSSLN